MKAGWEVKQLIAVSAINYGYTESASSEPVGPRFLRITDIQDDRVDWDSVPYCKIESADAVKYRLASGDIVFARTGATTGKSFLINDPPDAVFASYLIRLRLSDRNLLPEFVALFFQTSGYWKSIKEGSVGSAQGGFNATKLGALSIPVPSFSEQQRIVNILDEAFGSIATAKANAEKNRQNACDLFESYLQSVFTQSNEAWRMKTLGTLGSFRNGINYTKASKGEQVKIVGVKDFQKNYWAPTENLDRVEIDGKLSELDILRRGDILVVRSNGNLELIGRCILAGEFTEKISHSGFTIRIRLSSDELLPQYLCHFMKCTDSRKQLTDAGIGTNIKSLNQQTLFNLPISFPSILEQKALVNKIESVSEETQRLESIYRQKLVALDALKKSLLHKAFTGEL